MRKELPTSASFLVSENCNLACTYCFELACRSEKKMTKEIAKKGIDFLSSNAIENGERAFHVMFFGGEPLLNLPVVEYIFEYGLSVATSKGLEFTTSMVTNATILNDEVKRIFKKYGPLTNLSVQLSVDGIKEVHDKYRVTRKGKGSFDIIAKNIPEWKELLGEKSGMDYSIHGCSNKYSLPFLFENYMFFRETWGIERIWFMPIHSEDWSFEDVKVYEEQLNLIADYVIKKTKELGHTGEVLNYAPLDRCLSTHGRPSAPCGAGKNFVSITAEGHISPCHQFYFNDQDGHSIIGHVDSGIDEMKRSIYVGYDINDLDCLQKNPKCEAVGCYICIADNFNMHGSILSSSKAPRCAMSKIEKKIQDRVKKEIEDMGLFNRQKNDNGACECNSRSFADGMARISEEHECCGGEHCKGEALQPSDDGLYEMLGTTALAVVKIGETVEKLNKKIKKLEKINKKILINSRGGKR